ncbi:MAG TPA: winged helix-turn-helix domain-containing protein [Methanomicrobiales archaeon]|nr:winged helix-turn-helix domain-containing protein [Methanomicrobiales archaeon]
MGRRERSQGEIIQDLLEVTIQERPVRKTYVMHRANLSTRTFERYFAFLLCEGFITSSAGEWETYTVTESGRDLHKKLKEVNRLISMDPTPAKQPRASRSAKAALFARGRSEHAPAATKGMIEN